MKPMKTLVAMFLASFLLVIAVSCKKDEPAPVPPGETGLVSVRFEHHVDSVPLELDTLKYVTDGGIQYKVTDLQYFISRITLYKHGGEPVVLSDGDSIRYIDLRLPETRQWQAAGTIEAGDYDSVAFTFGLDDMQNISNRFPDPPERDMFWPEVLGGGYHHMKLNSVWKNCCTNIQSPFMMHLGTGQIYSSVTPDPDSIIGFVPNWFHVCIPASSFTVDAADTLTIGIVMNIDHWFNGPPNLLDLSTLPQGIMQNQELMSRIRENGMGAFTFENE
jgi:hypothetical protein